MGQKRSRSQRGKAVDKFSRAEATIRSLRDQFLDEWSGDPTDQPKEIFHYTTMKSGIDIVTSKRLWLFSLREMVDKNEVVHACRLVREVVVNDRRLPRKFRGYFDAHPTQGLEEAKWMAFAFCLVGDRESEYHWQNYVEAKGGERGGMAIGFRPSEIVRLGKNSSPLWHLLPMQYCDDRLRGAARDMLNKAIWCNPQDRLGSGFWPCTAFLLLTLAIWFKRGEFAPDREWRIQSVDECTALQGRVRESESGRHFIEVEFPWAAVTRVRLRSLETVSDGDRVREAFRLAGHPEIPVERSEPLTPGPSAKRQD